MHRLFYLGLAVWMMAISAASGQEWSKPVNGVAGRLVLERIDGKGVHLAVELRNEKSLPLWVMTHSPFTFDVIVQRLDGEEVKPDAERADITYAPAPAILPRDCRLAMPVTLRQEERWNLDIVTKLWSLKPGKYRLAGKYVILGEDKEPVLKGKAYSWQGTIELPEIEIEISE